jgi:hypothetical protein
MCGACRYPDRIRGCRRSGRNCVPRPAPGSFRCELSGFTAEAHGGLGKTHERDAAGAGSVAAIVAVAVTRVWRLAVGFVAQRPTDIAAGITLPTIAHRQFLAVSRLSLSAHSRIRGNERRLSHRLLRGVRRAPLRPTSPPAHYLAGSKASTRSVRLAPPRVVAPPGKIMRLPMVAVTREWRGSGMGSNRFQLLVAGLKASTSL